ncbi:MAG: PIG-L deacetylase family protein [Promethearchaeota archaeon]
MTRMKTIAAIGAHHDDVEIGAGGVLAKLVKEGHRVLYVVATTTPHYELAIGHDGRSFLSNSEVVEMRKRESLSGAGVLGIPADDVYFFDFKSAYWYKPGTHERRYLDCHEQATDDFIYLRDAVPGHELILNAMNCTHTVNRVMQFLDEHEVDIVLTHFPDDPHNEHYSVAALVHKAVISLNKWGQGIDMYAWDEGDARHMLYSFGPTHIIDITSTIEVKLAALMVFKSQFKDRDPQPFIDYTLHRAKFYGRPIGVEYAEAFMRYNKKEYSHVDVALPFGYDPSKVQRGF